MQLKFFLSDCNTLTVSGMGLEIYFCDFNDFLNYDICQELSCNISDGFHLG